MVGACASGGDPAGGVRRVPVEVAAVANGPLTVRRTFHASLEASSRIEVTTVVGGRLATFPLNIGDRVERGQVVATLDRGDYAQAVRQARASLAMAEARRAEAESQLQLSLRELERVRGLHAQNAASASELDTLAAEYDQRGASAQVAEADIERARAALASARVGLTDASIVATWTGDDETRVVAERFADEGTIVAPNTPLLSIVDLDPLRAVTFATERDYGSLRPGQPVALRTDAWPGEVFPAEVARVAPVFDVASRQARVELAVPNADRRLVPGLFVSAEVAIDVQEEATTVPADALVTRDGRPAVFVVGREGDTASLRPVEVGVRDGERVQVLGEGIEGRVVVLGQQLLHDGAPIVVVEGTPGDG